MHKRESIMQSLKAALEGIVGISDPIKAAGNTGLPNDLIMDSAGTYTGTALITYTITISTGGISGTAKCTVTGSDPSGPHTITSGTPIAIGSKGVTVTFTFSGSMQVGDVWTIRANVFNHTVSKVQRIQQAGMVVSEFPAIIIAEAPQDYQQAESKVYTPRMGVLIEAWIKPGQDPGTQLNAMLEDIENALKVIPNQGGFAFDTQFVSVEPNYSEEIKPFVALSIEIAVTYKQVI